MALTKSILEDMFLGPSVLTEAEAIDYMAEKFLAFFLDSTVSGSAAAPAALVAADIAFRAALVGMSEGGLGAVRLQSAILAFWASALVSAPTVWVTVPVIVPASGIPPVGLSGIAVALSGVFASNISSNASQSAAASALADAIFPSQQGGTVTLSPPPPGGTPLTPIL